MQPHTVITPSASANRLRVGLGIDTGGTYTDAVIYDFEAGRVVGSSKTLTTKEDLSIGIGEAIDRLPAGPLSQVELVSLSTTLATNACVEDRGGRAKLVFIGGDRSIVEQTGARYGLPAAEEIYFLDAAIRSDGRVEREPDWDLFAAECVSFFKNADAAAVVAFQGIHNPALEKQAKDLIARRCGLNAVCGHELFWNLNYIKRGSSTLLNTRLLPIIDQFLLAVRRSMDARHVNAPIVVMRSDGTLMSEAFSKSCPVETILCGPAASVMGSRKLAGSDNCLVVDMGGTTTDIAMVRDGAPVKVSDGVSIGKWSTFVDSVYIHTFGLGGDSRIAFHRDEGFRLGPERVMPLCAAAARWPVVRQELEELVQSRIASHHPLQEFLYLVRDVSGDDAYTDQERTICRALKDGPLRLDRLARAVDSDLYHLNTARLERESILMRCGLTPTDIMHLRGDFTRFDKAASTAAAAYVSARLRLSADALCDQVYDRVKKTLYLHLAQTLLEARDPSFKGELEKGLHSLLEWSWDHRNDPAGMLSFSPRTAWDIVGIGAPIHVFLPEVAQALGARCLIPENAPVANALGAIVANISASVTVQVQPALADDQTEYFRIYAPEKQWTEENYETACRLAAEEAEREAREEAARRGAAGEVVVSSRVERDTAAIGHTAGSMMEIIVTTRVVATATGAAGF